MFELFIPYIKGASADMKDNLNGYYKTDKEYADALITEDSMNGSLVYQAITSGNLSNTISHSFDTYGKPIKEVEERVAYAKAECSLFSPDGFDSEDVDSMIDKFVSQREFLVTAHFDMREMEAEFEEELREWAKETLNILVLSRDIIKKGVTKRESDMFVERFIPRRELRISFLNKSGKRVNFLLKSCEIEKKIARNRYIFYVKRMEILK